MDDRNVGSLEACKRLHDAEIVVETEKCWMYQGNFQWEIVDHPGHINSLCIPALSMAEAWRMLPHGSVAYRIEAGTMASFNLESNNSMIDSTYQNTNPTDALIDLLIWLEAQDGQK
jgi:hypothetical protein